MDTQEKQYMSTKEAAAFLGIAVNTLHKRTMRKEIPFYRIGGYIRFEKGELIRWIESRKVEPEK